MIYDFRLNDKNGREIKLGDTIRFSNEPDVWDPDEEASTFTGKVVFACGAFGIGTDEDIPDFISACGNDNYVSFWEIYDGLSHLSEFTAIEDYLEVLIDECEECLFNSKCEYKGKCND